MKDMTHKQRVKDDQVRLPTNFPTALPAHITFPDYHRWIDPQTFTRAVDQSKFGILVRAFCNLLTLCIGSVTATLNPGQEHPWTFMQFELGYFSAVFVTPLHPKLPITAELFARGFLQPYAVEHFPLEPHHGQTSTHGHSDFPCVRNSVGGLIFLNFVMPPRSAMLFYPCNGGYSRHTGLSIPQAEQNFITVGLRSSKQHLTTFLEKIWNRYHLDFFYLMKGTLSTSIQ